MREVADWRQSRFAECPAKRAKGDAIVSDGWKERVDTGVWEISETLLKWCLVEFAACGILELDDAFDFLRWRLFAAFGALKTF